MKKRSVLAHFLKQKYGQSSGASFVNAKDCEESDRSSRPASGDSKNIFISFEDCRT